MKYYTKVNDQEFEIEIDQNNQVWVNGQVYQVDFHQMAEAGMASLLLNNRSLEAFVEERDEVWQVLIHGELYGVHVQDERAYQLAQARGGGSDVTGEVAIKSPMPGIVIAISVAEGDMVQQGDKVVILESMKMGKRVTRTTSRYYYADTCRFRSKCRKGSRVGHNWRPRRGDIGNRYNGVRS